MCLHVRVRLYVYAVLCIYMYSMYMYIFVGEIPVAETTSHQMLRLFAFSTCLIRLLGVAFSTLQLARYKEFIKQVGRTIR